MLLALFFSVISIGAAYGLLILMPSEGASSYVFRRDVEATTAADAGIRDTMAFISDKLANNQEPVISISSIPLVRSGTIGQWNWSTEVYPDIQTPPYPPSGIRMYKLVSTALHSGRARRRITAWVEGGTPMSRFAMFTNSTAASTLTDYGIISGNQIEGPVHSNHILRIGIGKSFFTIMPWAKTGFNSRVTSAAVEPSTPDGVFYNDAYNPGDSSPYKHPVDGYDRLLTLGRTALQTGVQPIAYPNDPSIQAKAAWGGPLPPIAPAGVTVNPSGGVFVNGDVDSMVLGVDGSGNPTTTIKQGGSITIVTDMPGMRQVQKGALISTVTGSGTGVIFSSGNISALKGTVKGKKTIATDFANMKDIRINGDILRADTPKGNHPTVNGDGLGLLCSRCLITNNTVDIPRNLSSTCSLYAHIFCADKFEVESHNDSAKGLGQMQIFGGVTGQNTWQVLSIPSGSGFGAPGIVGAGRFPTPQLVLDPSLSVEPPPFYPISDKGSAGLRYWKEEVLD